MAQVGCLLIFVHIWCCYGLVTTQSYPYHELWTTKIKSLELMTHLLNDKIKLGEQQRIGFKSELASLKNMCGCNQTVNENKSEIVSVTKDTRVGEHAHTILQNAFQEQKHYVHQLVNDLKIVLTETEYAKASFENRVDAIEAKHARKIDEIEEKHSRKIDGMQRKYEQNINEIRLKHDALDQRLQRAYEFNEIVEKEMIKQNATNQMLENKLGTILAKNARLGTMVDENAGSITRMKKRRCQTGTFGNHAYPKIWFPRTYRVDFDPPFETVPSFMHALQLVDVVGTARVNAALLRVNQNFAEVKIVTWSGSSLYGARVQWMACP